MPRAQHALQGQQLLPCPAPERLHPPGSHFPTPCPWLCKPLYIRALNSPSMFAGSLRMSGNGWFDGHCMRHEGQPLAPCLHAREVAAEPCQKQLVLLFSRWRRAPSLALSIRGMEPSPYSTLGRAPSLALSSTVAKSPIACTVFHCLERPHRLQSLPLSRQALLLAFSFESPSACCCLLPSEILMRLCPTAP